MRVQRQIRCAESLLIGSAMLREHRRWAEMGVNVQSAARLTPSNRSDQAQLVCRSGNLVW